LPLSFLGCFLLLGGIVFLIIYFSAKLVDTAKPQERDSRYYRFLIRLIAEAAIPILSCKMEVKGLEKTPKSGRFFLVCNHLSLMDPVILLHYFRKSQITFISKKENQDMFLVGKVMHKLLCQLIDRENDREALKTILKCVEILKEDKASIGVFPEGYILPDRKLHEFRPGVFKIAQKAKVPIVVCTLKDTAFAIENLLHYRPSDIELSVLQVLEPEEFLNKRPWRSQTGSIT
jgi:1-acyl-sn-glycerol-3-phosphate acyltransferase